MKTEDVLVSHALAIYYAERSVHPDFVPFEGHPSTEDVCIAALAAALRVERERVAELEGQLEARIAELASIGDGE